MAVFAMSAVAVAAAQATTGPVWITGSGKTVLASGSTRSVTSSNVSSNFHLEGPVEVECKKESATGTLKGGTPGTDTSTVTFSECSLSGKKVSECSATGKGEAKESGIIKTSTKTVLAYLKGKAGSSEASLDATFAESSNNVFAEFTFEGSKCGLLQKQSAEVSAEGTEIELPTFKEKRKCGVLAEVGKISGGKVVPTKAGEVATEGGLKFPGKAGVKEAEVETSSGTYTVVTCKLHAKATLSGEAGQLGEARVETSPLEAFGWEV
jgi:hypothetical protein